MSLSDQLFLWTGRVVLIGGFSVGAGWVLLDILPRRLDRFLMRHWCRWRVTSAAIRHAARDCECCYEDAAGDHLRDAVRKLRQHSE